MADPGNAMLRKDLAYIHKKIADLLAAMKDWPQALHYFSKALVGYKEVVAARPQI